MKKKTPTKTTKRQQRCVSYNERQGVTNQLDVCFCNRGQGGLYEGRMEIEVDLQQLLDALLLFKEEDKEVTGMGRGEGEGTDDRGGDDGEEE